MKKSLLLEPYFTGSHKQWAEGYQQNSSHSIELLTLTGHYWKWRMHGGAVTLARMFLEKGSDYDLLLATDMLDLTTFLSITRKRTHEIPVVLYMHENQLTYPWSLRDQDVQYKRDNHYSFINYTSCLAADRVFFNSQYHLNAFLDELPGFLKTFPDQNELETVDQIREKSVVLPLGIDLKRLDEHASKDGGVNDIPLILWNHRWEYDKNPTDFFNALYQLADEGLGFEVAIVGEQFPDQPEEFRQGREKLGDRIVQFGYCESFSEYARWLWQADIIPVTSNQDFFGASLVEAMYCNTYPLIPYRLAFPGHFPEGERDPFLYADQQELITKLRWAINNKSELTKTDVRSFVEGYDWTLMAPRYDQVMAE